MHPQKVVGTLRALYLDLNSFFASCEQQRQPKLRGKPVAVVPSMTDTTSVIAASYEAKAFGVRTGTRVGDAKKMCPGLICVAAGHGDYVKFHHQIKEVVESVIPIHAVRSIDEFACELTGSQRQKEKAVALAEEIKKQIKLQVGEAIKASIGIGPNFLLAKIATDMKKPDGLTVLESETLREKLIHLKLQDIPGIGRRMEARLHNKGIFNLQGFLDCSQQQARALWGSIYGAHLYRLLNGEWIDFRKEAPPKSIGHQHVLPPVKRNDNGALLVAHKLLWKAAIRLRKKHMMAQKLSLSVRYVDRQRFYKEISFHATQDSGLLLKEINRLYAYSYRQLRPMKVSIVLSDFVPEEEYQMSFFDKDKGNKIYKAVDALNARYGRDTVYAGTLHQQLGSAPTRIAFQRIPELDEVD